MWVKKTEGEFVNLASARKVVITEHSISAIFTNGKEDKIEVLATGDGVDICRLELLMAMNSSSQVADMATLMDAVAKKPEFSFKLNSAGESAFS